MVGVKKGWHKIALARPKRGLLVHYTTKDTFKKIIEGRQLYATKIQQMNDIQEFTHGFDFLLQAASDRLISVVGREDATDYLEVIESQVYDIRDRNIFVVCLSEKMDSLSQWRGYGGEEGVGIVFRHSSLLKIADVPDERHWVRPCLYSTGRKGEIARQVVESELSVRMLLDTPPEAFDPFAYELERFCF